MPFLVPPPQTIHLEAENATLYGPRIATARPGFSGTGYVTDITKDGARLTWHITARAGLYLALIRYANGGEKGTELAVNGFKSDAMLPASGDKFATQTI